ncbi:LysE family translocator [Aestuariirhabdus litorea]|uniref:LysE family translocator n=1 Tax=Aestuariirhabdus litorea TaxID=2528527 RepID=A0A3P3VKZ8_9GAMM|nr:LysE family translocator [Aestuariirhabdus litorea]RRJ83064.1 LysE family translocator [Aestuariirhabdus litorea]RWW93222.1 LysE family translocator [Endozoicomonadaceae bacterium GTF-13]
MVELSVLLVFIPTFFLVSITPGMCMTLAMTMGMTIGVRRTLWMMWGELLGVGLVSVAAVIGVAAIMLNYPSLFLLLKYGGGGYLVWLGIQMWRSRGKMVIREQVEELPPVPGRVLFMQGFVTAIANPKGWAFMISLLPPFVNSQAELLPQLMVLVGIILCSEFICMLGYASGGRQLRRFLQKSGNVRLLNRIAGSLMIGVGVWLASG